MNLAFGQRLRTALGCEGLTWRPYVVTTRGRQEPESMDIRVDESARTAHVALCYANALEEDLFIAWDGAQTVWRRRTVNRSADVLPLVELGLQLDGLGLGSDAAQDYFYHAENPRIYQRMTIPVRLKRSQDMVRDSGFDTIAGNRWADPGVVSDRVGASPYQPFPAVLLSNYQARSGLVHGTLAQRVFFHNYLFRHGASGVTWDILSSFKAVAHRDLAPGAVLDDTWYLGRTEQAADIERVFEGYVSALRRHLPPLRGAGLANRHTVVWGSWNDGVYRDFDQERLFKMAEFIRDHLPTVEWMQIDDGYAALSGEIGKAHGLGMPYEGAAGVDKRKFPDGFKAFTDGVKERGVRPAVWTGGHVRGEARLYRDHPDWFLDYSYRLNNPFVLDVSKPAVRAYLEQALDFFTIHGGYEGIKLDFWSYAFEDSHALLSGREAGGYEWRRWFCEAIRRRLPDSGYFQTGCDIVMGNPFLAEWFNNYRYGIDIGGGQWDHVVTNFLWGAACFATHTGDLFVPNSDAIGLLPSLSDEEARTAITYCLISRSMVEVAGWLYQNADHPRMAWVKKALCCPNNGQDVHFADYDYRDPASLGPPLWYLMTPHFARLREQDGLPLRTLAVFNLADQARDFSLTAEKLRLPPGDYRVTDVWSLETADMAAFARFSVAGRGSRLLAVSPKTERMEVLDANLRVEAVQQSGAGLDLRFAHAGDLVLVVSPQPRHLMLNAQPMQATVTAGAGNWRIEARVPAGAVIAVG